MQFHQIVEPILCHRRSKIRFNAHYMLKNGSLVAFVIGIIKKKKKKKKKKKSYKFRAFPVRTLRFNVFHFV